MTFTQTTGGERDATMQTAKILDKVSRQCDSPCEGLIDITFDLQATESGVASKDDQVMVACDASATVTAKYSVVVQSPSNQQQEPTVVSGETETTHTTKETLTRPAEKSAIEKYSSMEEDPLNQAILEGRTSSSSDNGSETAKDKDQALALPPAEDARPGRTLLAMPKVSSIL